MTKATDHPVNNRLREQVREKIFKVQHFINGQFVDSESGAYFNDLNPATGQVLAEVAEGGEAEIDRAASAARKAFRSWSRTPVADRSDVLRRIGDLILEKKEELAELETLDVGKPISLSLNREIPRAAYNFHFFADFVKSLGTECFPMDGSALNYSLRQPVGVAGLITPWNLPLLLLTWKLAPCLAAGNTAVAKPAELTPLTAARLGEICAEAGLPDGVFNVVHGFGPDSAGEALTRHPDVNLISFTGETATGRAIMAAAAPTLKRLSFELGGKNPNVIFADADLERAVESSLPAAFANQGEVCLSGSRVFVERPAYDEFLHRFVAKAKAMRIGDPMDSSTEMGALISADHLKRVESYVKLVPQENGRILCGGQRPEGLPDYLKGGSYLQPTVIVEADPSGRICREEIFGPVVTVEPFDDEEGVVELANATPYGLSATLWTSDVSRAHRVASRLDAGIVWINTWFLRDLRTPFGGMKQSGIGREGGVHSFEFFSELKNICLQL